MEISVNNYRSLLILKVARCVAHTMASEVFERVQAIKVKAGESGTLGQLFCSKGRCIAQTCKRVNTRQCRVSALPMLILFFIQLLQILILRYRACVMSILELRTQKQEKGEKDSEQAYCLLRLQLITWDALLCHQVLSPKFLNNLILVIDIDVLERSLVAHIRQMFCRSCTVKCLNNLLVFC